LDLHLAKHPELGSRSFFIKNLIREGLDRDAQADIEKPKEVKEEKPVDGIVVKLPPYLRASVDALAQTLYNSPEEYIRELVRRDLDADGQKAKDVRDRAIFVATSEIGL
jgi:Arc/MetJ-type ribon-helix-helix transcriptional regulator